MSEKFALWKAHNLSETQSILIHDLCERAYIAGQNDLKEENARLREALRKIALEEYGRPTEMMLIARKAIENEKK